MLGTILRNVDGMALGIDAGTELGYLYGSFMVLMMTSLSCHLLATHWDLLMVKLLALMKASNWDYFIVKCLAIYL